MTDEKDLNLKEPEEANELESLFLDDFSYETILTNKFRNRKSYVADDPKKITAFIPGKIKKIHVKKKSKVKEGELLLVLEAMKMNNQIFSPAKGTVKEVYVTVGMSVSKGALLIEFK